jgi:YidC/Oxa1 family membrane protein insertase
MQRIILILGLAITSYLLVLAWNDDYHQNPSNGLIEPDLLTPAVDDYAEPMPEGSADAEIVDELPGVDVSNQAPKITKPVAERRELIKISTDVLDMWIDTAGGDITRVDLH